MSTDEELRFILRVAQMTGVLLDPVYTGKALYRLFQRIKSEPEVSASRLIHLSHDIPPLTMSPPVPLIALFTRERHSKGNEFSFSTLAESSDCLNPGQDSTRSWLSLKELLLTKASQLQRQLDFPLQILSRAKRGARALSAFRTL